MKRLTAFACAALVGFAALSLQAEEEAKKDLKCPVSGQAAKSDHTLQHNGATVQFCCDKCPKAFQDDTAKYAAKANEQIVLSGQAKQVKCPLSGGKLNPETKIKVASVEVAFCCNMCKGKVEKATGDEQLGLVLSDAAFKKGFELKGNKQDQ